MLNAMILDLIMFIFILLIKFYTVSHHDLCTTLLS